MDAATLSVYLTVLRIIHIVAGAIWVGTGVAAAFYIFPVAKMLGKDGSRYLQTLVLKTRYERVFPIVAILTTVAGILLYERVSGGFSAEWMRSPSGMVLSIGAVFGLLAFGHGGAAIGRMTGNYKKLAETVASQSDGATAEQQQELIDLEAKMDRHGKISLALSVIALLGMAAARHL